MRVAEVASVAVSSDMLQASSPPWSLAWRLAAGQIVSWGILYYAFTVVVGPMQAGTGWSRPFLNAGVSLGLLVGGLCALPVGAWIQRRGGRGVMTLGSLVGGGALVLMGTVTQPAVFLVAWLLVGLAMAGVLYEPAFAVVVAFFGPHYRRGITLITLLGGLASTVFIPVAQFAVTQLGWRGALIALGAVQVVVGVPLHALGIPRWSRAPEPPIDRADRPGVAMRLAAWWRELRSDIRNRRFVGLAIWFTAHSAAFSGLIFQLVPILQQFDVPPASMLTAIALIGPMQVLGRLVLAFWGSGVSTLRIGGWALAGIIAAMLLVLLLPPHLGWLCLFAALFGAGNGVMTIVRGTAVAELFGRDRYAELNGALALPAVLARSLSPLALAALWTATGAPRAVFAGVLVLLMVGGVGLFLARRSRPLGHAGSRADGSASESRKEGITPKPASRATGS